MAQNVTRTIYINAKGEAVNTIRGLNAELTKLTNAYKNAEIGSEKYIAAQKELDKVKKIYAEHSASLRPIQSGYTQLTAGLTKFATAAGLAFSIDTVIQYGREVLKVANTQEQFNIALNTMVGTKAKADQVIAQGIALATNSPFTITQVQEGTKQLLAMGFSADEVIDKLEILGNIGAGVGTDKLPQLTLALGQVKAAGRLTGQELNQFVQAGVPLLEEIGKAIGKPTSEIKKMVEAGQVGYPIVEKALRNLTTEGGRFAGLMEKQAQSLGGLWSTLGDNFTQNVTLPIGQSLSEFLKPAIKGVSDVLGGLNDTTHRASQGVEQLQIRFNLEMETLKKANLTQGARKELITSINKEYKDYLPALLTEKTSIQEIEKAQTLANAAFTKKITMMAAEENLVKVQKDLLKVKTEELDLQKNLEVSMESVYNRTEAQTEADKMGDEAAKSILNDRQALVNKNLEEQKKLQAEYNKTIEVAKKMGVDLNKITADTKTVSVAGDPEKAKKRAEDILNALKSFNEQVKTLNADLQQNQEDGYQRDILKVREKYQKQFDALAEFRAKYPEAVSKANAIEAQMTDLQGKTIQSIISNQFKDLETELEKHNAEQLALIQSREDKEIAAINQKYEKQIKILIDLENDTINTTEAQRKEAHKKRIEFETVREQEVNNLKARLRSEQAAKDAEETAKFFEEMKKLKDDVDKYLSEKPIKIAGDKDNLNDVILNITERINAEKDAVNKAADDLLLRVKDDAEEIIRINKSRNEKLQALNNSHNAQIKKATKNSNDEILADEKKLTEARLQLAKQIGDGFVALADLIAGASKKNTGIQKAAAIAQLAIDTATAISSITAKSAATSLTPIDYAIKVASGIAIVLANIARARGILATVEQKYMGGFHNVVGATDGQTYKAQYVGAPATGMLNYNNPVLLNSGVLANERGPEYFVANSDLRNPAVFNYVQAIENIKSSRTPQYQDGGFAPNATNSTANTGNNDQVNMMMIATMQELNNTLKSGIVARFEDVWATVKDIKEYTDRYKKITGEA
jgi:tape measure domain-containing protein